MDAGAGEGSGVPRGIEPGALTALLRDLAAAPEGSGSAPPPPRPGQAIGRFEVLRELGRGGFGVVYLARDRELGREVALKLVRPDRSSAGDARVAREAEAAARLSHPNLVTLFEAGHSGFGPYLVFELLRGRTLQERLEEGPLSVLEAIRVGVEVARGLAHAHAEGVVHRDLKPANVFLCDDGTVKVLDFGLALAFGRRRTDGGTPAYMAPEQRRGAPEDERTDVYALGAMLYRMLAGELPPATDGARRLLSAPALEVTEVPGLGELIGRMLARDPLERPRDAVEVLAALEALHPDRPDTAGSAGAPRVRRRPGLRRALQLAAAAAAGVLLALAVTWYASRQDGRRLVVLVADTVNATGDRDLDAISGLLLASLEQSHRLSILSRSRVLELAREHGRDLAGAIDETVGREIGRSGGARALLLLAVHRLGSLYALELRGLDPARDAYLFTLREEAPTKEAIIPALERIAERVRRELHEPARDVEARTFPVASVTASLEAYRHYFQGRNQAAQLAFPEAVASLQKALAADPDFALAHLALSQMVGVGQLTDAVRAGHREAALRLQARLPPRERSLLVAATAEEEGRPAEAEQLYRVLAEELPDDAEVRLLLGELLLDQERPAEAAPFLSRALELSPADEVAGAYLFRALGFLGRGDEILAAARRGRAASPGAATTLLLAEALLWSGDVEAAVGAAREALALGDAQAPRTLAVAALRAGDDAALAEAKLTDGFNRAAVELFKGRPLAARAALDGSPTRTGGWAALITRERVVLRAAVGPPEALRQEVERLAAHDGHVVGPAAAMVAWAGEAAGAARLAGKMERGSLDLALYRAVADWRGGRRDEAVVALQALAATHASGSSFVDGFLLAEACLEAGRADLARPALLRHEQRNVSLTWLAVTYPATLLMLATAEEALGRPEDARRTAARLERLWRDAEPGYPGLLRLRALEARLGR